MTELKREYVVPLRRKSRTAPKWRRSKKAVVVLQDFIKKHMKSDNVVLCKELNEKLWENGMKNPPGKVSVVAIKSNINGTEKTLVNLLEVGVDKQVELYKAQAPKVEAEKPQGEQVVDAKAEEKEKVEPLKKEEKKVEAKKEVKKDDK